MDERGWDIADPRWRECNPVTISAGALCSGVLRGVPVRMAQILRSCRNGRGRLAGIKFASMAALAVLATACCFSWCSLLLSPCRSAWMEPPIAAKPVLFEHSPYLISVGQAYGIVVLSRCLGAAWFSILIALLSILFRQTVLTTFSGIAVSILPHLIGGSFLKYVLPPRRVCWPEPAMCGGH